MTTYIALFNLTDAGIKAAKDSPRRLDAAKKRLENAKRPSPGPAPSPHSVAVGSAASHARARSRRRRTYSRRLARNSSVGGGSP